MTPRTRFSRESRELGNNSSSFKINCFEVGTDPSENHVTRGAMRATHLTLVKLKRKQKEKKGRKERKRREGEERRERGKMGLSSLYDLWRSNSCLSTGKGLKSEYTMRAMCGYWKLQVSPRFRAESS